MFKTVVTALKNIKGIAEFSVAVTALANFIALMLH